MKKVALFIMFLFLGGCGASKELDMTVAEKVIDAKLNNMVVISDSTLTDAYGLNLENIETHIFKQNEDGDLYAIIKTNKKTEVKNEMKDYFAKVKDFNESYSPERLEILENRLEKELGNYLIYIVAKNNDTIYQDILNTME